MADIPLSRYLQVKVETLDDDERLDRLLEDLNDNEDDNVGFESEDLRQPPPSLSRENRQQSADQDGELELLREELCQTHEIVTDQSTQLEKAEKKISELEDKIHHQEELLMRTEADQSTDKAVANAEITALRSLLGQERKRRIVAEQKFKTFWNSRRSFLPVRNRTSFTDALFRSSYGGRDGGFKKGWLPRRPSFAAGGTQQYSQESDDIEIVNVVQKTPKKVTFVSNTSQATSSGQLRNSESENATESFSMFPCTVCGLTFNDRGELESHVQCHRIQSNFGSRRGTSLGMRKTSHKYYPGKTRRVPRPSRSHAQAGTQVPQRKSTSNLIRDKKFICKICGHPSAIVSQLKTHMKQAHGILDDKFSIGCRDCGIAFPTRKQHVRHRRYFHGTMYCSKGTPNQSQDSEAVQAPPPPPVEVQQPASIPTAGPSTSVVNDTAPPPPATRKLEHKVDVQKLRLGYYCTCGRSFRTLATLREHTRRIPEDGKYICDLCGRIFTGLVFLKLHMLNFHKRQCPVTKIIAAASAGTGVSLVPPVSPNPNLESNVTAANETSQLENLTGQQQHKLVGPDPLKYNAKYSCTCGREYVCRGSFLVHAKSKNMGKIFRCSLCPSSFDLHGNLKNHVRSAHKISYTMGRFACGNCAQTFDTSSLLVRHRLYLCKYRSNAKKNNNKDLKG